MQITVEESGLEAVMRGLGPEQVGRAMTIGMERGSQFVAAELRRRVWRGRHKTVWPPMSGRVVIRMDRYQPPRWATVRVKGKLAHLIEGGTGALGIGPFSHAGSFFPNIEGIMRNTGLEKPEAFLIARAISLRGGNPPHPMIVPTWDATHSRVEQMADEAVDEAFGS